MRLGWTTIAFLSLITTAANAAPLVLDRASAPELLRTAATPRHRTLAPNLLHAADVENLPQSIVLQSTSPLGAPPAVVGKFVVEGATTLRLHVETATPGTVLWLAGEDDDSFERFEPGEHATWTPTTRGSTVYVAMEGGSEPSIVTQLAIGAPIASAFSASCVKDVACTDTAAFPELEEASRAVAMIRFVRGSESFVCTGALVNDASHSGTAYMLTARHCISTSEEAASIEVVWDYRSESCGTAARNSTRTYGAELLVSSASTDVALLRLTRLPAHRTFLTVDATPLVDGTKTYRLSHADGESQSFSEGVVHAEGAGCLSAPRPQFLYTSLTKGAVASGSSGAPLLLPGLRVVGQLLGRCGASANDACAVYNDAVDGSMVASWPMLAPYLDPPAQRRRATRH